jgi:hypothetical protein
MADQPDFYRKSNQPNQPDSSKSEHESDLNRSIITSNKYRQKKVLCRFQEWRGRQTSMP